MSNASNNMEVITSDEFQQLQAEQLARECNQDEQAERAGNLISVFVSSYERHKTSMPLDRWLVAEFKHYPDIWHDEAEIEQAAQDVIGTVTRSHAAKVSLCTHLDQGKSQTSWVAGQIEQGAKANGIVNVGEYAGQIEAALEQANADMARTIFNKDGNLSQALNLDGFLAEQHHVDSFNLEAAAQGSPYRARALVPDGTAYGKNSMDIGIYKVENGQLTGKPVARYQAKYGKDAQASQTLWDKGDYRGQQKLVPAEQAEQLKGAKDCIEYGGVQSKPLTKAEAKALQDKAQQHQESKTYDWNDVTRGEIAKTIGKQALIGAGMVAGFHGVRVWGRRLWNGVQGKENPPLSEDLKDFFQSSVKGGFHTGVQVAVSGAVVVSAKNGWLGAVLKRSPVRHLSAMAYMGMENAKALYKYAQGELSGLETIDVMGRTTASLSTSLAAANMGMTQGAALGGLLGPAGAVVGGLVGGVVAGMAGSKVGELVYEGGKSLVKTAFSVVSSTVSAVYSAVSSLVSACNPFNWW